MVRLGFQNFYFRNRFVSEMHGAAYGMSRELRVGCFCGIYKIWTFGLSPDYFRGQAWPDLWLNACYCCKLNNMMNM